MVANKEFRRLFSERAHRSGVMVPEPVLEQLETYFELLARWTAKINLTSLPLSPPTQESLDRLLIEPLLASKHVENTPITWFDLGSGGGSPAIPLKILRPTSVLTMVESRSRKAAFLREAIRTLGLPNASVLNARVEDIGPDMAGRVHLVTVRALSLDATILESVRRLLARSGRLLAFASAAQPLPSGFLLLEAARSVSPDSKLLVLEPREI